MCGIEKNQKCTEYQEMKIKSFRKETKRHKKYCTVKCNRNLGVSTIKWLY